MISKILSSVNDFKDQISSGEIKVCLLRPNTKISEKGWAEFVSLDVLQSPEYTQHNLGISLVGQKFPGDKILTCIDIDGDKREVNGINIEQFSKTLLFETLATELDKRNIKYMAVKSSSGGYHIYLYTYTTSGRYDSTIALQYPKNQKKFPTEIQMYLDASKIYFDEIKEDLFPKTAIEIWCEKRYMVAPGSDIFTEEGEYIGTTTLLERGVQNFKDIGTIDTNLNDLVREILIQNGFTEQKDYQYYSKDKINLDGRDEITKLSKDSIQIIGDILVNTYPKISGQKHTCTLALGGYLFRKNIHPDSIKDLGEYVINNSDENLFKNKEAFIKTLLHDTETGDKTRFNSGLPTVEEILQPYIKKEKLGKKLHLATNPIFHTFWPSGRVGSRYEEITMDFKQNIMRKNLVASKTTEDGEVISKPLQSYAISNCIQKIEKIIDLSDPEQLSDWERPLKIEFTTEEYIEPQIEFFEKPDSLFKEYRRLPGAYTDYAKGIVESVYREYGRLGLIKHIELSTKPGIYYSEHDKMLRRFDYYEGKVIELPINKPSKENTKMSLQTLKKINDAYPWEEGKLAFLIKTSLTMPYTDILKRYFRKHHPCIILYGEAGTLKTTAGELAISIHQGNREDRLKNITSASEFYSEFRFGRALDSSTYPMVVDESEYLFQHTKYRNMIKDSVTGYFIRKPGGDNPKSYYSHRATIFTMNDLPSQAEDSAFLRRFIPIEFDRNERGDLPEVQEKLAFLNTEGVQNNEFKNLHYIGDYILYILNNNINLFNLSVDQIQDHLIEELEKYTQEDLSFLKKKNKAFSYTDRTEQDNSKLTRLLYVLRKPFIGGKSRFITQKSDIAIVEKMLNNNNYYPYINRINDDEIMIDIGLKNKYNEEYNKEGFSITLKGCYNTLLDLDLNIQSMTYTTAMVQGRKQRIRGIKITIEDFTKILVNSKEVQ